MPAPDEPTDEAADQLVGEFADDVRRVDPGSELTFGRSADLVIDSNRFLHRVLGRFRHDGSMWWLDNAGSAIALRVDDVAGSSYAVVAPGTRVPLTYAEATVSFEAGRAAYRVTVERPALLAAAVAGAAEGTVPSALDDAEATTAAVDVPLNDDQTLLLAALAEPFLRRDGATSVELGTNRQVAARLGWTITKFNRKLDWLCQKFAAAGVAGLVGSEDLLARDRRQRLVEHVLHTGIIGPEHLARLDDREALVPDPDHPGTAT